MAEEPEAGRGSTSATAVKRSRTALADAGLAARHALGRVRGRKRSVPGGRRNLGTRRP